MPPMHEAPALLSFSPWWTGGMALDPKEGACKRASGAPARGGGVARPGLPPTASTGGEASASTTVPLVAPPCAAASRGKRTRGSELGERFPPARRCPPSIKRHHRCGRFRVLVTHPRDVRSTPRWAASTRADAGQARPLSCLTDSPAVALMHGGGAAAMCLCAPGCAPVRVQICLRGARARLAGSLRTSAGPSARRTPTRLLERTGALRPPQS